MSSIITPPIPERRWRITSLRLGIAGLGTASRQVLPHINKFPGIELTGGADLRKEALDAFAAKYQAKTFPSVQAICESDEIDAVWISTPNIFHAEHTVLAAEHGKHVIVEKPMAVTLEEADRMIEAAERNKIKLIQGHSKIYNPPVRKMREVVQTGNLGRLIQLNSWNYNDWLQRPRIASEVDTNLGGGIVYRQGPHQTDIVRCIGGGMVRSVRATTGRWDSHFGTEGNYTAFLNFEDGTPATMVFNAYGFFNITDLTWGIGEGGDKRRRNTRKERLTGPVEADAKYAMITESEKERDRPHQPFFGLTIASCEKGDIRQSPDGLFIYSGNGCQEVSCSQELGRVAELRELYEGVTQDRPVFPDGRWGKATLEVCLAILQSSREKREVVLSHQVPCPF